MNKEQELQFSNPEAERCLLGAMLRDFSIIDDVSALVAKDDYSNAMYGNVYDGILEARRKGFRPDVQYLITSKAARASELIDIEDSVPSSANWSHYAEQVVKYSQIRSLTTIKESIGSLHPDNVDTEIERIQKELSRAGDRCGASGDSTSPIDLMIAFGKNIDKAIQRKGQMSGYETGFKNLDAITDGLQKELIFIGARPSIGKTAFAVKLMKNLAKQGIKPALFSIEMSKTSIALRMVSSESGINSRKIKSGFVNKDDSPEQYKRMMEAMESIAGLPFVIDDRIDEAHDIAARIRRLVRLEGVKVAIIDHFSIAKCRGRFPNKQEQMSEVSTILRDLRKELGIPIIALAQLKRDAEGREPGLSDLRETGAAEQDADAVFMLHRERMLGSNEPRIPTQLLVLKNRNGPLGIADLDFIPNTADYEDRRAGDDIGNSGQSWQ